MTEKIRQRIAMINAGEVPEGYTKTKAGIMPTDWINKRPKRANEIFRSHTNKNHNGEFEILSASQERGIIPRKDVEIDIKYSEESISGYKKVDIGDFVISLRSFQGGIEYSTYEGLVSPAYTVLKPIIPISDTYYKNYMKTTDFICRLNSVIYGIRDGKQIGFEDFGNLAFHYPPLKEQKKIAEILTTCDKVIELKEKLVAEKQQQKKKLVLDLLSAKKRLKDFTDEWGKVRFDNVFDTVTDFVANGSFASIRENVNYLQDGYAVLIRTTDYKVKSKLLV